MSVLRRFRLRPFLGIPGRIPSCPLCLLRGATPGLRPSSPAAETAPANRVGYSASFVSGPGLLPVSFAPSMSQDAFSPEVGDFNAFASKASRAFTLPVVSAEAFSPGVRPEANLLPRGGRSAEALRCRC